MVSKNLKIHKEKIAISSTGVIDREIQTDIVSKEAYDSLSNLSDKPENSLEAAKTKMTTDTFPKKCTFEIILIAGEVIKIEGITKGSGMIAPNIGTMLSFIVTDDVMSLKVINGEIKQAADISFNMLVVDGDNSSMSPVY